MLAVFLIRNPGTAFSTHLVMLTVCLVLACAVHHAAPVIVALRGWRKVAANVGMTAAALIGVLATAHPQLVAAKLAIFMECYCYWGWESWCCYF